MFNHLLISSPVRMHMSKMTNSSGHCSAHVTDHDPGLTHGQLWTQVVVGVETVEVTLVHQSRGQHGFIVLRCFIIILIINIIEIFII